MKAYSKYLQMVQDQTQNIPEPAEYPLVSGFTNNNFH